MAAKLESAVKEYQACEKEVQGLLGSQQAFVSQLNENHMVRAELDILEDDAEVFKAVGPVLIKIDLDDAKASVKQRIDRLTSEAQKTEKSLKVKIDKKTELQQKVMGLQREQQAQAASKTAERAV